VILPARKNPVLLFKALLYDVKPGQYKADMNAAEGSEDVSLVYSADSKLDRLDLSMHPYSEKHLKFLSTVPRTGKNPLLHEDACDGR
jgi:hypothetical protein